MQIAMQIAIIALMSTFVYALVALGFTLVFGILRVVNFAHGEFYMLGAYAMYVFYGQFGWPYLPSIAAAAVLVGVLGLLAERGLFRRFAGDEMGGMIPAWETLATVWAAVEPLNGREFFAASTTLSETTTRVRIRYRAGLTVADRINHGGTLYNIQASINPRSGDRELVLMCKANG